MYNKISKVKLLKDKKFMWNPTLANHINNEVHQDTYNYNEESFIDLPKPIKHLFFLWIAQCEIGGNGFECFLSSAKGYEIKAIYDALVTIGADKMKKTMEIAIGIANTSGMDCLIIEDLEDELYDWVISWEAVHEEVISQYENVEAFDREKNTYELIVADEIKDKIDQYIMEHIDKIAEVFSAEELKAIYEHESYDDYPLERILGDAKYNFESLKSAPFFGEETLGIYVEIYKDLAKRNYAPALYQLGLLYYNGEWWLDSEIKKSLEYHKDAAELGNADAMFELYVYYATGQGVEMDTKIALEWCEKSAANGNSRAAYNMGSFYATGNGVEKDTAKSIEWYKKASQAGHGKATATIGVMYKMGDGVEKDDSVAESHFTMSECQGFSVNRLLLDLGISRY